MRHQAERLFDVRNLLAQYDCDDEIRASDPHGLARSQVIESDIFRFAVVDGSYGQQILFRPHAREE